MPSTQRAQLSYLRIAPRKVRAVADVIRGLTVQEAEVQLLNQRRRAARPLLKLLRSAAANAKNNARIEVGKLFVASITVDQGPMLKRYLPRARGVATPIHKKTSHVTLILEENPRAREPRFVLAPPKKKKKDIAGEDKKKREKPKEEFVPHRKKPGFFKRMFSRKTGV